ncbi:MAG: hypothetical protein JW395_0671 [Nitrospira sp.]|nr:hypothetical protein [Nitrospira sp.]
MWGTLKVELALSALRMAREARRPGSGLIHHSDPGSQYPSGAYRAELAAHGMVASMSAKGDCYDSAVAESCFSTLEFELLMGNDSHMKLERLQPPGIADLQAAVLLAPPMDRRVSHAMPAAHLRNLGAAVQLLQDPDDLLFRQSTLPHRSSEVEDRRNNWLSSWGVTSYRSRLSLSLLHLPSGTAITSRCRFICGGRRRSDQTIFPATFTPRCCTTSDAHVFANSIAASISPVCAYRTRSPAKKVSPAPVASFTSITSATG